LSRALGSQPETEVDAKVIASKFDRQRRKRLRALHGTGCQEIDRPIAGGLFDLRIDDRPVSLDPEIDDDPPHTLLRPEPILFDPVRDLPQVVGKGEVGGVERERATRRA
jgi:hypothetical protein